MDKKDVTNAHIYTCWKVVQPREENKILPLGKTKKQSYDQPRQHIIKQRHYFANKGLSRQGYGFFQ